MQNANLIYSCQESVSKLLRLLNESQSGRPPLTMRAEERFLPQVKFSVLLEILLVQKEKLLQNFTEYHHC